MASTWARCWSCRRRARAARVRRFRLRRLLPARRAANPRPTPSRASSPRTRNCSTRSPRPGSSRGRTPVLLLGETGVGKEEFARGIHGASGGPYVALNCGGLSRELLASELFGYAEGAFTGARKGGMAGKIEAASGGTLFLDEIGEMPADMQPNLLRVLEQGEIYRLGENTPRRVNFRLGYGHAPRPAQGDRRRPLPHGPVLPHRGDQPAHPAAARPPGRHREAGAPLSSNASAASRAARRRLRRRGTCAAARLRVATCANCAT